MQKKIVALAVAGLSTAAFAQTNVTVYGVADVSAQGYSMSGGKATPFYDETASLGSAAGAVTRTITDNNGADKVASGNAFALQNNSSLIGFKGTEDLGNGLKALFQAETTINITGGAAVATQTQNGAFGALRDSFVGMNSKYGTALAGYLSTPYRSAVTSFDVLPGATGSGRAEQMIGNMRIGLGDTTNAVALDSSIRATAIAYAMPTLYGFDGSIAYTGSANNGQNNNQALGVTSAASVSGASAPVQSAMSLNLGWTGYGVNVKGAFQQAHVNLSDDLFGTAGKGLPLGQYTSYLVGAAYTGLPGLKASVLYNRNSLGINAGGDLSQYANKLSNNQLYTGVSYRIGNWEPRLAATWTSSINGSELTTQTGARQWVLNTGYYLSKRTQVYGLVSNLNNSSNQNYFGGQQLSNMKPTGGQNLFTYGMGVRTTF